MLWKNVGNPITGEIGKHTKIISKTRVFLPSNCGFSVSNCGNKEYQGEGWKRHGNFEHGPGLKIEFVEKKFRR